MRPKPSFFSPVSAIVLSLACSGGLAQTITAGVNGTVTDSSGAVLPNAKVTATNVATNVASSTPTTKDGVYVLRNLQIGQYKLMIEAAGFATQTLGPFTLETGQDAKLDAKLGVEGSSSNISVNSEVAPLLNTENPTLGTTLDATAIAAIPLIGRNFTELTLFVPGAVTGNPSGFTSSSATVERNGNGTLASQNGNRQESNNFLLEGIDINETINNQLGYNPSPDAIGQMRVISSNAPAEFGNVGGGQVITLFKNGTNKFHGSAFFYLSNYNMDANTYANKHVAAGSSFLPITPYTQSTFGGTFGGPIIKDKLFFFVDYEGIRFHSGGVGPTSVATAKMRTGDFSELLDPNIVGDPKKEIQLYNTQAPGQPAYANNQLGAPTNPVAQYLYAHPEYYPLPNHAPLTGTATQNNYFAPNKTNRYNNQFDVKVNYTMSPKDTFSGSYSHGLAGDFSTPALAISFPGVTKDPFQSFSFDYVRQFSIRFTNDLNIGYSRVAQIGANTTDSTGHFGLTGDAVIGVPGIVQAQPGFIAQSFTGSNTGSLATLGNSSTGTNYIDNTFSYTDVATYQLDRHTIKAGFQSLRYQQNTFYPGNDGALGHYDYSGQFTAGGTSGGFSLADFNLDRIVTRAIGGVTGPAGQRQYRTSAFAQDDYKATPSLTFNIGLRWEYDEPIFEVNNKQANINVATKKVVLAGQNGNSRALFNGVWTNFMPRLGFAWNPTPKAVIRGGYGVTTYFEGTGANLRLNFNYPFQNGFTATAAVPSATSSGSPFNTSQAFGTTNTSCDITTSPTPCTTFIRAWDMNIKPMFLQEFNLTAEYQLSNTASVTFGYLGQTGQHLISAGAGNALPSACVINGAPTDPNSTSAAVAAACPTPYANLVGQTGSVLFTNSNAMENYNSLQTTYRQRLSHGLEFTANYTYAKALTNSTGFFGSQGVNGQSPYAQNYYDNHSEYGPAAQDVRHNLNGYMNYTLPVGRGQMYFGNMNRVLDEAVGGWHVAMTALVYSGFPVNMGADNKSYSKNNSERANHLRTMKIVNRTADRWFGSDPSAQPCVGIQNNGTQDNGSCAYAQPAVGTFGNASVDSERAPGYQSANASVFKDFAITDAQHISFRADAANVFNITSLGNPNNNTQSTTFGQITNSRSQARQLQLSAKYVF